MEVKEIEDQLIKLPSQIQEAERAYLRGKINVENLESKYSIQIRLIHESEGEKITENKLKAVVNNKDDVYQAKLDLADKEAAFHKLANDYNSLRKLSDLRNSMISRGITE